MATDSFKLTADGFFCLGDDYRTADKTSIVPSQLFQKNNMVPLTTFVLDIPDTQPSNAKSMASLRNQYQGNSNVKVDFTKPQDQNVRARENYQNPEDAFKSNQTLASAITQCVISTYIKSARDDTDTKSRAQANDNFKLEPRDLKGNKGQKKFAGLALSSDLPSFKINEKNEDISHIADHPDRTPGDLAVSFLKGYYEAKEKENAEFIDYLADTLIDDVQAEIPDIVKIRQDQKAEESTITKVKEILTKNGWQKSKFINQLILAASEDLVSLYRGLEGGEFGQLMKDKTKAAIAALTRSAGSMQDKSEIFGQHLKVDTLGFKFNRYHLPNLAENVGIMEIGLPSCAVNTTKNYTFSIENGGLYECSNQTMLTMVNATDSAGKPVKDTGFDYPKEIDVLKSLLDPNDKLRLSDYSWVRLIVNQTTGIFQWSVINLNALESRPHQSTDSQQIRYIAPSESIDVQKSIKVPISNMSSRSVVIGSPEATVDMVFVEEESATMEDFLYTFNKDYIKGKQIGDEIQMSGFYFQDLRTGKQLKKWTIEEIGKALGKQKEDYKSIRLKEALTQIDPDFELNNKNKSIAYVCCYSTTNAKGSSGSHQVKVVRQDRKGRNHAMRPTMTQFMKFYFDRLEEKVGKTWASLFKAGDATRSFVGGFPLRFWGPKHLFIDVSSIGGNIVSILSRDQRTSTDLILTQLEKLRHNEDDGNVSFRYILSGIIFKSRKQPSTQGIDAELDYYTAIRQKDSGNGSLRFTVAYGVANRTSLSSGQLDIDSAVYVYYTMSSQ